MYAKTAQLIDVWGFRLPTFVTQIIRDGSIQISFPIGPLQAAIMGVYKGGRRTQSRNQHSRNLVKNITSIRAKGVGYHSESEDEAKRIKRMCEGEDGGCNMI